MAKKGTNLPQPTLPQPLEIIKTQETTVQSERWQEYWNNAPTAIFYHEHGTFKHSKAKPDATDQLERKQHTVIGLLQYDRFPTAQYLNRIGKHPDENCLCGEPEDTEHILIQCSLHTLSYKEV